MRGWVACALLVLLALVLGGAGARACFDPMDWYSGEVLLNKPGVTYNFSVFERLPEVVHVPGYGDVYVYRSHFGNAVVIVYAEECANGYPDYGIAGAREYYPGIRIEFLNASSDRPPENRDNLTKLLRDIVDFELGWLREIGVISGLSDEDIDNIVSTIRVGYAGWNSRLVYYRGDGKWHPYHELIANGSIPGVLLKRMGSCRWVIPEDIVPDKAPEYMVFSIQSPGETQGTSGSGETQSMSPGSMESMGSTASPLGSHVASGSQAIVERQGYGGDGYYVLLAVMTGLIVSLTLLYILRRR